ncbi:MAG: Fe-S cluster assembly sulfur transfer protein SufU [Vicinamibacterales bacterium]
MSDLRDLYQEVILDHNKRPRNFGELADANRRADGHNPLCGDRLRVTLRIENDVIADIRFEGSGCAISKASASLMTERVKGQTIHAAEALFTGFHRMVTEGGLSGDEATADMGKLAVLAGVAEFPTRVKCATLAWHTLRAALREPGSVATTEVS